MLFWSLLISCNAMTPDLDLGLRLTPSLILLPLLGIALPLPDLNFCEFLRLVSSKLLVRSDILSGNLCLLSTELFTDGAELLDVEEPSGKLRLLILDGPIEAWLEVAPVDFLAVCLTRILL